jgi:hypothetical protein
MRGSPRGRRQVKTYRGDHEQVLRMILTSYGIMAAIMISSCRVGIDSESMNGDDSVTKRGNSGKGEVSIG